MSRPRFFVRGVTGYAIHPTASAGSTSQTTTYYVGDRMNCCREVAVFGERLNAEDTL